MDINYGDIIVLNSELKRNNLRYHVSYKNEKTACIEPRGGMLPDRRIKRKNTGMHSGLLQKEKYHRSFYRRWVVFFL